MIGSCDHDSIQLCLSDHLAIVRVCRDLRVRNKCSDFVDAGCVAITNRHDPSVTGHVSSERPAADPRTNQADGNLVVGTGTTACQTTSQEGSPKPRRFRPAEMSFGLS